MSAFNRECRSHTGWTKRENKVCYTDIYNLNLAVPTKALSSPSQIYEKGKSSTTELSPKVMYEEAKFYIYVGTNPTGLYAVSIQIKHQTERILEKKCIP